MLCRSEEGGYDLIYLPPKVGVIVRHIFACKISFIGKSNLKNAVIASLFFAKFRNVVEKFVQKISEAILQSVTSNVYKHYL